MTKQLFDLNIEEVLENWDVTHALREVISNALDEQALSESRDIAIFKDGDDAWHIRDYGRGLQIRHFTLRENPEKLAAGNGVIGKFGVGLKDALATFHRRGVSVVIRSQHGTYRLRRAEKHSFEAIETLHVAYDAAPTGFEGTEFILDGVSDGEMAAAKALFLRFNEEQVMETTPYGQILRRQGTVGRVYILGVLANEEPNFAFSYNIMDLTKAMRDRLNRDRLNVGRTAYAPRIKAILTSSTNEEVHRSLMAQVNHRPGETPCDEVAWIDVSQMALNLMHESKKVVYFTPEERDNQLDVIRAALNEGYEPVPVTEKERARLDDQASSGGPKVWTVTRYFESYSAGFEYGFIEREALTPEERAVFDQTPTLFSAVGVAEDDAPPVRVSETMRVTRDKTEAVWDRSLQAIIVKHSALASLEMYSAAVLHALAHATSEAVAGSLPFEATLTAYLGKLAACALAISIERSSSTQQGAELRRP